MTKTVLPRAHSPSGFRLTSPASNASGAPSHCKYSWCSGWRGSVTVARRRKAEWPDMKNSWIRVEARAPRRKHFCAAGPGPSLAVYVRVRTSGTGMRERPAGRLDNAGPQEFPQPVFAFNERGSLQIGIGCTDTHLHQFLNQSYHLTAASLF